MKRNLRASCALLSSLFLAAPALADEYGPPSLAITPRTGILGHGADLSLPLAEDLMWSLVVQLGMSIRF